MRLVGLLGISLLAFAQIRDLTALDWSPTGTAILVVAEGSIYLFSDRSLQDGHLLYGQVNTDWARFGGEDWFLFAAPSEEGFALWRGFTSGREPELIHRSPYPIRWPTVSADGTKVAFVQDWDTLVVLDLEEGKVQAVLGGAWPKATPEFAPNGKALVFCGLWPEAKEPSWEIFYFDLGSRDLIQLTSDAFFDWCPRISPDGAWVAFVSNRGGFPDIWILPIFGGSPFPLTQDPWVDAFPAWSPEGGEVGYASLRLEGWVFLRTGAY